MTQIFDLRQIKDVCERMSFAGSHEDGFGAYSRGEFVIPPVGELTFTDPPGNTHIKSSSITRDKISELGQIIHRTAPGQTSEQQRTVADLTGVAVQEIKKSDAVYRELIRQ